MKRSACVNLVLLGSAVALSGCDSATHELQQQLYSSKADCDKDWGDTEQCAPAPAHTGYYLGPRYYWDPAVGRPMAVRPDGTVHEVANARVTAGGSLEGSTHSAGSISRGGFGSSGHGFGGGYS
jgi:hypothetical protein